MCLCMRSLLALVLMISLDHFHILPICSLPSPSPKYFIDTPIENPIIFYTHFDLGYEDKMFNVLGGNVDNFLSLGYLVGIILT